MRPRNCSQLSNDCRADRSCPRPVPAEQPQQLSPEHDLEWGASVLAQQRTGASAGLADAIGICTYPIAAARVISTPAGLAVPRPCYISFVQRHWNRRTPQLELRPAWPSSYSQLATLEPHPGLREPSLIGATSTSPPTHLLSERIQLTSFPPGNGPCHSTRCPA